MLKTYQERMSKIFDESSKLKTENHQLIEDL